MSIKKFVNDSYFSVIYTQLEYNNVMYKAGDWLKGIDDSYIQIIGFNQFKEVLFKYNGQFKLYKCTDTFIDSFYQHVTEQEIDELIIKEII